MEIQMAKQKKVVVQAFLPQLSSAHADQQSEGSGTSLAVAIKRAVDSLLKNPRVKGRRLQVIKLSIAVVE
jgi:hypothetical protein